VVRWLAVVCLALAALCAVQWRTLARLKSDLAAADARALRSAVGDRRDELVRAMAWLDASLRSQPDLQKPAGLCPDGRPDADAVGRWVFDVYLTERVSGASESESRRRVLEAIRSGPIVPR